MFSKGHNKIKKAFKKKNWFKKELCKGSCELAESVPSTEI